jgi:hypothetical protein
MSRMSDFDIQAHNIGAETFQAAVELQHLKWQRMDQEGLHTNCAEEGVNCALCQQIDRADSLIAKSGVSLDWEKVARVAMRAEIDGIVSLVENGVKLDEEEVG